MVSSMREAGETVFRACSAWVNQLMKSCRELWKSVASVKASSSFTCGGKEQKKKTGGYKKIQLGCYSFT